MNIDRAVKSALAGKLGTLLCANAELGVVNEHLLATVNTQQAKIAELEAKISELAAKEAPQNGVAGAQAVNRRPTWTPLRLRAKSLKQKRNCFF